MSFVTRIQALLKGDRAIWAILLVLGLFSILTVYSSTAVLAVREQDGNTEAYLFKHLAILTGGLVLAYFCHKMHYMRFSVWAPVLLLISVPMLAYTIFFGAEINEARRWITLPYVGLSFQTSDFAEIALIIYVARAITAKQEYIKDFKSAFLPIIMPVVIICGLIAPANLSTALVLFLVCLMMMFVGRVALKYIGLLLLAGVAVFALLVLVGQAFPQFVRWETWASRVNEFMNDPDGGYQVQQAKIAIANGGWFGLGPGRSIQRNYLPSAYADSIYGIICEEYGIVGAAVLLLIYIMLFFRVTRLVTKSSKAFGAMAAIGLAINMIIQAFGNVAVSVHLIPVTGLSMPIISLGGTSLIFTCISFGIILSVSKFVEATGD